MVKLRLKRMGNKFNAFYRIVAATDNAPRDGRFIEEIGYYNPHSKELSIEKELVFKWLNNGAQPTDVVKNLLKKENIWQDYSNTKKPKVKKSKPKSKQENKKASSKKTTK